MEIELNPPSLNHSITCFLDFFPQSSPTRYYISTFWLESFSCELFYCFTLRRLSYKQHGFDADVIPVGPQIPFYASWTPPCVCEEGWLPREKNLELILNGHTPCIYSIIPQGYLTSQYLLADNLLQDGGVTTLNPLSGHIHSHLLHCEHIPHWLLALWLASLILIYPRHCIDRLRLRR
jgi:hypothetical protein